MLNRYIHIYENIRIHLLVLFITLGLSFNLAASPAEKSYQQCVACHGDKGQGNEALKTPALAGQYAWYLSRQLTNFSSELRGQHEQDALGKQMAAIAKSLNFEKELGPLTAYIESLTVHSQQSAKKANENKHFNGIRYYQAKCGACHGGQAQGNKAFNAPKLSGLSTAYLKRQMDNFSMGIRGTEAKDKFGRQMAMMAKTTSGTELDDIIYYISRQKTIK